MLTAINGIELAWTEEGRGEPLLWLHGFMGCGEDWRFVFPAAPEGFRLVAPDLPGHGASTARDGAYSFRRSAEDVLALLDHLGIPSVSVIGLSGGGITALHMATLHPARVTRMVVISAPPSFPEQARAIQRQFSEAMIGEADRQRIHERHRREGQVDALVWQTRAFADGNDPNFAREDLATISAETLIVFGDRDPLYPVSIAFDMYAAIPRSWLWIVPNGGHGPVFREAAPAFRKTAMEFLSGGWSR
jgi:pimeloyl-ACP methyl ester carboxylesterase